ncbi:MAG: FAD-binding protein [Desulfovibrio sp.]
MPPAAATADHACHVLVLGAGLAGMRAAWAAKEAAPALSVTLLCPHRKPSGSSFANRNNALGVQAPLPHEAETFVAEALRLARPGEAAPELVRALADDAPARLGDLLSLGLNFRREPDGSLTRFPGCFSAVPRAVVFDGLAQAHAAFQAKVQGLGVRLVHGFEALELLQDDTGRVRGARLANLRNGTATTVRADAVVAALGGPAPLFGRRLCGPGGSGLAYGLLHRAGARLMNARFLQFFWGRARGKAFVNPGALPWPEELASLAAARRTHCPVAYGLPDAALDRELLARRGADGLVRLPGTEQEPLALFAHAGNGGARIDAQGHTTTPGLYACGECAGGMHGAQRLGGGMVLSALVFGARAGRAAAQEALEKTAFGKDAATLRPLASGLDLPADAAFVRRLRRGMDRHAAPFAERSPAFAAWLAVQSHEAASMRQRLLALSALLVLGEES